MRMGAVCGCPARRRGWRHARAPMRHARSSAPGAERAGFSRLRRAPAGSALRHAGAGAWHCAATLACAALQSTTSSRLSESLPTWTGVGEALSWPQWWLAVRSDRPGWFPASARRQRDRRKDYNELARFVTQLSTDSRTKTRGRSEWRQRQAGFGCETTILSRLLALMSTQRKKSIARKAAHGIAVDSPPAPYGAGEKRKRLGE